MVNLEQVRSLVETLAAYSQLFGLPEDTEQLRGIVGTFITLQQRAGKLRLTAQAAEDVVHEVLAATQIDNLAAAVTSAAQQELARQAQQWRQSLESIVKNTLNAYVGQKLTPTLNPESLQKAVASVVPLIEDGQITQSEVRSLVTQVGSAFNWEQALGSAVNLDPKYVKLAKNLAITLAQKPMEDAVSETVTAYVKTFEPTLETVGESLIEQAVEAILLNKVQFDWDTELSLENKQLLVKQVLFKLNVVQALPAPSKTAQQIAAQVHNAVEQFRAKRAETLEDPDVTAGSLSVDDLSIRAWTADSTSSVASHESREPSHRGPDAS